jgi:hypothetical protein
MKYKVVYLKPKKKKGFYSEQTAVFYDHRDALNWRNHVRKQNCKEIQVLPVF